MESPLNDVNESQRISAHPPDPFPASFSSLGLCFSRRLFAFFALPAFVVLLVSPGLAVGQAAPSQKVDALTLMRRMDELWRGKSSKAVMRMEVKTRHYQRTMRMMSWSLGKERSLVRILAPKKDKGIATLKVAKNIWNYLPKINRVSKVPPSMMMGSWMGSHFTNDDLVRESSYEEDYESSLTFSGQREGKAVYEVTSLPRPNAPVVWGKVITVLEQGTLMPLSAAYYDEEGTLEREMVFSGVRRVGGRSLPTRMEMRPLDKPGEYTAIVYEQIEFDTGLSEGFFSLQRLRKR